MSFVNPDAYLPDYPDGFPMSAEEVVEDLRAENERLKRLEELVSTVARVEGEHGLCPVCDCVMDDTSRPVHNPECYIGMAAALAEGGE